MSNNAFNLSGVNRARLTFAVVLAAAAALRLSGLDRNPLWNDELFSWHNASAPTVGLVIESARLDVHPPGYFVILHGVIRLFGDSEAVLRMPSAIAGILAVWAIYALGLRFYSQREALGVAALLAFSWPGVYYAQNARAYAPLLLLVILSFYFWLALVRRLDTGEPPGAACIVGYSFAALGAAYLHYFGLLVVFLQGACMGVLLVRKPRTLLIPLAIYGCLGLAYVPWVPAMLDQMAAHDEFWIREPQFLSAGRWQLFAAFYLPLWQAAVLIVPALLLAALAVGRTIRAGGRAALLSSDIVVAGWCALPFLAAYIQSVVSTPVLTARNLIVIMPALYFLFVRGIWSLPWRALSVAWYALALLAVAWSLKGYFSEIGNERFDLAAAHVIQHEPLPIIAHSDRQNFFDYYFIKFDAPHRVGLRAGRLADMERISDLTAASDRFWLLSGPTAPNPAFLARLSEEYILVEAAVFYGATAWLFQKDSSARATGVLTGADKLP